MRRQVSGRVGDGLERSLDQKHAERPDVPSARERSTPQGGTPATPLTFSAALFSAACSFPAVACGR